ncbi:cell division protein [Porphyromonas crevioricanis]|uniref:Cell division protein n=2 Tax=Porphyromonas crevioricanis TaxID=393921 RepID=A0A0A2FWA5_9PORP|nr:SPOR domain-containing protein [Porphyromonas crevioricanis]KGN90346.1 cell division protein [Porphyromonas crevioricanis]KGN95313.1 cell division protein [Porphyromonas crevioricanis]SJZ60548.1 Sporulation related domain-containing protein [Porphyromonas crevioricanis]SQH72791.1 Uncharacterized protein conserved in bacteria [Porphyromonas crevioricanis]
MKKIVLIAATLAMVSAFTSCKPKQSAYRQAYEAAKQREIVSKEGSSTATMTEVSKPIDRQVLVRQENLSVLEGENANSLKRYSVVVGSFQNHANARSLKERMQADGYEAVLAQNEQGMLRVIVSSFHSRQDAAASRDAIKARYAPNFQDAWLLEKTN